MQMNSSAVKRYVKIGLFTIVLLIALLLRAGNAEARVLHPQQQCSWTNVAVIGDASISQTPNASRNLYGIAMISATSAWAVGTYTPTQGPMQGTIYTYNGSYLNSYNPQLHLHPLYGVADTSASDVWAVGQQILHFNGTSWRTYRNPGKVTLHSVAALTPQDAWAAGSNVIEHWNGKKWRVVPNPATGTLSALAAVSPKDIWAVGANGDLTQTFIEHWNGTSWSIVPSPNPGSSYNQLFGATALTTNDVWAVGWSTNGQLIEHWDGTSWSVSPTQNGNPALYGIAAFAANDIWAVGDWINYYYTLTDH